MIKKKINQHQFALKWMGIALVIKLTLFIFFAFNFLQNWPSELIINNIFIISGDTTGYYNPVESFINGNGYDSFCRMPGLLPIYAPLNFLFGAVWGKTLVIVFQFFMSVIAVYIVSKTALLLFKKIQFFYITFFIFSFSSFSSIWDHYGYSDSFAISFLIISVYFIVLFTNKPSYKYIILSGFFITWSIFFRPVHFLVVPIMSLVILLQEPKKIGWWIKSGFLFFMPILFFISIWSVYNYSKYKKIIFLQGSFSDCYAALPEEHLAIRDLIIAWGGDFQEWTKGTETEWFFTSHKDYKNENPFNKNIYTDGYNLDSLIVIKEKYDAIKKSELSPEILNTYKTSIIKSCNTYIASYKKEHFFRYYILNPLKLIRQFAFPSRLDNLPLPKLSEMKWYQKIIKGGYLVLLNFIMLTGFIGILLTFSKKNIFGLIPIAFIVILAGVLGFIEQRYLAPAYPLMCIFSSYTIVYLINRVKKKNTSIN